MVTKRSNVYDRCWYCQMSDASCLTVWIQKKFPKYISDLFLAWRNIYKTISKQLDIDIKGHWHRHGHFIKCCMCQPSVKAKMLFFLEGVDWWASHFWGWIFHKKILDLSRLYVPKGPMYKMVGGRVHTASLVENWGRLLKSHQTQGRSRSSDPTM